MARKKNQPPAVDRKQVAALPRRSDVWQFDARPARSPVPVDDQLVVPWLSFVTSFTDEAIVGFDMSHEEPTLAEAEQLLLRTMCQPQAGEPHRPTAIQVQREHWATGLRAKLESLNVEIQVSESLEDIDQVYEDFNADLAAGQEATGLLDMPGVNPEAVGGLFDAAAYFFEQAPWKKAGERPIQIACSQFESGPWYAVLMGQGGMTRGLVLYDRLETVLRIQEGDLSEEENARLTSGLTMVFGGKDDLLLKDVEAAALHGWKVAAKDAFPTVYRIEPGLSMRPPLAWEVQLLEGCLRVIPEFVRKKTRRLAPLELAVPTAGGELQIVVSWAGE
jgi:hypothetical protein